MRWLMNYLRQVFCGHHWVTEEVRLQYVHFGGETTRISATCSKCGYHRVYDKWRLT